MFAFSLIFAVLFLKTQTLSVNTITCYYGPPFLAQTLTLGVVRPLAATLDLLLYNRTCKQSFCSSTPLLLNNSPREGVHSYEFTSQSAYKTIL